MNKRKGKKFPFFCSPSQVALGKEAFFKVLLSNYSNIGIASEILLCLLIDDIKEEK